MKFKDLMIKIGIVIYIFSVVSYAGAQKKKPVRKAVPRVLLIEENSASIPEIKDFAFVAEIDKNANVTVKIQKTEDSKFLADNSSNKNLTDFFSAFTRLQNKKTSTKTNDSLAPIVIVEADSSLN